MSIASGSQLAERVSTISESATMKVAAEAGRLKREGVDVIDFSAGEPDFPTPDNIKNAAVKALTDNFTKYTDTTGIVDLKTAICERHKKDYGTSYTNAECVVTVGGKHVIFELTQVLLNPGDECIIPVPYWVTYKDVVNYAGAKCVFVETDEAKGFNVTAAQIEARLSSRTKLIIINSPSNPSGAVLARDEFEKICRLAKSKGIFVMTDECYCRFLYEGGEPYSAAAFEGMRDTVIVAGSLSKTYAMTGWRLGFGLAPKPVIGAIAKLQSHMTSNPTSIAQKAGVEALNGSQDSVVAMLAEYAKRRTFVLDRLRAIPGVTCTTPMGAFYAYPNMRGAMKHLNIATPLDFSSKLLSDAHVALVPGEAFGTNDHVRISYATSLEILGKGLDRIEKFCRG
jgi:aspartate aminotransferase